jgi:hypothetical protein
VALSLVFQEMVAPEVVILEAATSEIVTPSVFAPWETA